ncbi:uracil-DNA glycosylase [Devosia pacifica]|uniref:Uracil-DNA glycosylase n=1 Tax=Devosia pacifica TaxID=1335967 RepID=A0A918RY94_9HYPH|nr:uracil-DNA glycosylase family protein [Devosia pacifica]GHA17086.1 uracil-DNA glycosylase [Devosia pacifica]
MSEARACTLCAPMLPLGPRPVLRAESSARVLIIGQAPGTKVHETGIPWNDRSGDRLRDWLQVDRDTFYDPSKIAIIPMGFCYPGRDAKGGDLPPRPECAPLWHPRLMPLLPELKLTLLIGSYSQRRYLPETKRQTMTERVAAFRRLLPEILPLPHPSWRTTGWQKKHPWFDDELLPLLRESFQSALTS